MTSLRRGFSLVELSIVLVILGLLVGGILAGQSLIRASELRAVGTEYQRYVTAVNAFKDKYFALPGDMTNATTIWGAAHATPTTCMSTASTDARTCNGDGNGFIEPLTTSNETFRFWQQLANAGLIEGTFTGITADPAYTVWAATSPSNAPKSKFPNGQWWGYNWGIITSANPKFYGTYLNSFEIGTVSGLAEPAGALFKAEELWNIDTKLDDGKPGTGRIVGRYWGTCNNATAGNDFAATYALDSTAVQCAAMFRNLF